MSRNRKQRAAERDRPLTRAAGLVAIALVAGAISWAVFTAFKQRANEGDGKTEQAAQAVPSKAQLTQAERPRPEPKKVSEPAPEKRELLEKAESPKTEAPKKESDGAGEKTESPKTESPFAPTVVNKTPAQKEATEGMAWIPGGEFSMGSEDPSMAGYCNLPESMPDARPIHRVYVDAFWMDKTDVTNEQFAEFVKATGYITIAEQKPKAEDFPGAPPENLIAGSTVFTPTDQPVKLNNYFQWWRYEPGANWRHPEGPDSDIKGREKYPVVQVAYQDAVAYAKWAKKRLPTEAEWEFAARGGQSGKVYTWGDEFRPGGKHMANTYQGKFPVKDSALDGFVGIAPVAQFAPNGYGLYDMAGNVWQWCNDWYRPDYYRTLEKQGVARNPQGPDTPFDPAEPREKKRVHRGGSFLCTDQYCTRYMVGTRGKGEFSTASNHLGFRCVRDVSAGETAK